MLMSSAKTKCCFDGDVEAALEFWLRLAGDTRKLVDYPEKAYTSDSNYVRKRTLSEGMPFLALTLPKLGDAIYRSFEVGYLVVPPDFERRRGGKLPHFLHALLKEVYNEEGILLPASSSSSVAAIQQLLLCFKKYEAEFEEDDIERFVKAFCDTDKELSELEFATPSLPLLSCARDIVTTIFRDMDPKAIVPRPGPGSAANGVPHEKRFEPEVLYDEVHQCYPYYEYFYSNSRHLMDRRREYLNLPRRKAGQSVMIAVPKTFKGPRFICMMPHEYMHHQQGLGDNMRLSIASHPLARVSMPLKDQNVNRERASRASVDGYLATVDMSEASDRISRSLVVELFRDVPRLLACMLSLSPEEIILPSVKGLQPEVLKAAKFAPMGSSLCFPTMTVVHFALACASVSLRESCSPAFVARQLTVYGDDIILPARWVNHLFEDLPLFGMKFNQDKSFTTGPFRESCGCDAFKGINVAPTRVRKRELLRPNDADEITSVLDSEYALRIKGYYSAASFLRCKLEGILGVLPFVSPISGVLGWKSSCKYTLNTQETGNFKTANLDEHRMNGIQNTVARVRVVETPPWASMLGSWEMLFRYQVLKSASKKLSSRLNRKVITWKTVCVDTLFNLSDNVLRDRIDMITGVTRK